MLILEGKCVACRKKERTKDGKTYTDFVVSVSDGEYIKEISLSSEVMVGEELKIQVFPRAWQDKLFYSGKLLA